MNLFKRLLAAGGATGLLIGLGLATPVFAASPFSAKIDLQCAHGGDSQTITVTTASGNLVHIEVNIGGSTANGGTQNGTGITGANGFTDQWTIGSVTTAATATVRIWVFSPQGVSAGSGQFTIEPADSPCASPNVVTLSGSTIDVTQVSNQVRKTCDAGVTGSASFSAVITLNVSYSTSLSTTVSVPVTLTLPCNGEPEALPVLPVSSVVTLHETSKPLGAVAAADTKITIASGAAVTTIHNTKAAVATATPTPTPTTRVLPLTGQPASAPTVPWLAISLIGLLTTITGAGLILRRRS